MTSIGIRAFAGCGLRAISIPESVEEIGDAAFSCSGMTDVTVYWNNPTARISDSDYDAFDYKHTTLHVPVGTSANYRDSKDWGQFASIVETPYVAPPYDFAVDGIYYKILDADNVAVTCQNQYEDYYDLEYESGYSGSVTVPASVTYGGRTYTVSGIAKGAFHDSGTESAITSITLPGTITEIPEDAFRDCTKLESIMLPSGVTIIGKNAFYGCTSLKTVGLGNSLEEIGDYAFYNCYSIGTVTLPGTVNTIGDGAFEGCSGLEKITVPSPVTSIGDYAFLGCSGLKEITVPSSVISIGEKAFLGCVALVEMTVQMPTPLYVGENVFSGVNLSKVMLNVPTGSRLAYRRASVWKDFGIVKGPYTYDFALGGLYFNIIDDNNVEVTSAYQKFYDDDIESGFDWEDRNCLEVPSSVTYQGHEYTVSGIGKYAFYDVDGDADMTSVILPSTVEYIGEGAFRSCSLMASIVLPSGLIRIDDMAFYDCQRLSSIEIPSTVMRIGNYVFYNCYALKDVTVNWTAPRSISSTVFEGVELAASTLHVPAKTKDVYSSASVWKSFGTIKSMGNFVAVDVSGNEIIKDVQSGDEVEILDTYKSLEICEDIAGVDVSYSRTFKNTSWQPWYMPFELSYTSGLEQNFSFGKFAGTYTDDDGNFYITIIRLKSGDLIKANTSYFVKAKTADKSTPQVISSNSTRLVPTTSRSFSMYSAEKEVKVTGQYSRKTATKDDLGWYYFSGGEYCHPVDGTTLGAFRFYLTIEDREDNPYSVEPAPANVKVIEVDEIGEITGIDALTSPGQSPTVYDLSGRVVTNPRNGVYIINGKKTFIH